MRTDTRHYACAGVIVAALTWAGSVGAAAPERGAASQPPAASAVAGQPATTRASSAAPEPPPSGWSANAAAQLTRLEEQTVLLKAEIRRLDAQAEVAQRTAALARLGSAATIDPVSQNVRVVAIEGLGRRYSAVVQTGDGQRFDVAPGDELPNGLKIVSIGANEVVGRWPNGQTTRMVPVLAARSGAVFNAGTGAVTNGAVNGGANGGVNGGVAMGMGAANGGAGAPGGTLVPALDRATQGLPPAYQPVQ